MVGWIRYTKSGLESIQKLSEICLGRLGDKELGKFLYRMITENIQESGLLLNSLLNYFRVTSPIKKTDTVNILINEALKKNQAQLEEKEVKLFKKLEKDLPETVIPDKPLGFILNSILQYAVASMSSHETLGLLTRSLILQESPPEQASFGKGWRSVEITLFFTGCKKAAEPYRREMECGDIQREDSLDLILRMVEEMVRRNRGAMKIREDEEKAQLSISLEFPVERRRAFHDPNNN